MGIDMTVFRFESLQFDPASEPKNEFNPIFGYSVAEHLRMEFKNRGYNVTDDVDNEDWGWYFDIKFDDRNYMIGTCSYVDADEETGNPLLDGEPIEHLVQFDKHRSIKEKILGKNKLSEDDQLVLMTEQIIKDTVSDINFLGRD